MYRWPLQFARMVSLTGLTTHATPLVAAEPPTLAPLRLVYAAPANCPSQVDFAGLVSLRVAAPWLAPAGELARPLRVTVAATNDAWQARLELEDPAGNGLSRSVTANDCHAAVEAIALATALLLDSNSGLAQQPTSPEATAAVPENAAPRIDGAATARAPTLPTPPTPAVAAPPQPPKRSRQPTAESAQTALAATAPATHQTDPLENRPIELGGGFGLQTGLGSGVAYGASVFGGWSTSSTLTRLGIVGYQSGFAATDLPEISLRVRLVAIKLEHCPLALTIKQGLKVSACASLVTGILTTSGRSEVGANLSPKTDQVWWLMAGLAPKVGYYGKGIFAELEPDIFFPVTQRQFAVKSAAGAVEGSERAHRTPLLAFGGLGSLGLNFE